MTEQEEPDLESIDPNRDTCPVCGFRGFWKRHAPKAHPGWWEQFTDMYEPVEQVSTTWRRVE